MGAQGRRGTCRFAGVLPPWHDRCHGSRVWYDFLFVGEPRPPFGDGPRGSCKGQCPLTPDCALCAQGRRETCCLAGVLPPLGGGPRGSPVWHDFLFVGEPRPPFGDGPHGSRKGQCPLTPDCAPWARRGVEGHAGWLGFYHRGTTGATARGSGTTSCLLASPDRHSATGLMAR